MFQNNETVYNDVFGFVSDTHVQPNAELVFTFIITRLVLLRMCFISFMC